MAGGRAPGASAWPRSTRTPTRRSWPATSPRRPARSARPPPRSAARRRRAARALAATERRLAALYDLLGDRDRALDGAAATPPSSFAAAGLAGEAAAERLRVAGYRQSAGRHGEAVELAVAAADEATRAERTDLRARALGLEGVARAKRGEFAGRAWRRSGRGCRWRSSTS